MDTLILTSWTSPAIKAHLCLCCSKNTVNPAHQPGTTQKMGHLQQQKEFTALKQETIWGFCTYTCYFLPAHQWAVSQVNYMFTEDIIMRLRDFAMMWLHCKLSVMSKPQVQQYSSSKSLISLVQSLLLLGSWEPRPSNCINTTKPEVN